MEETSKRNFHAISQELKKQREEISDLLIKIEHFQQLLMQVQGELSSLKSLVNMLMAKSIGTGPTVNT